MNQNKQGQKTPRSIKYSNAALAGQQVTVNGQNFGLFYVQGQKVYLSPHQPTKETLAALNGTYYPRKRWVWHMARLEWKHLRIAIDEQLDNIFMYGCGTANVRDVQVSVIARTHIKGAISRLKRAERNKYLTCDLDLMKSYLQKFHPELQILEEIEEILP